MERLKRNRRRPPVSRQLITEIQCFRTIKDLSITGNSMSVIAATPFVVAVHHHVLMILGTFPDGKVYREQSSGDMKIQQFIEGSEILITDTNTVIENGIPHAAFSLPDRQWKIPQHTCFAINKIYLDGAVQLRNIHHRFVQKHAFPFLLILKRGAELFSGLSTINVDCYMEQETAIHTTVLYQGRQHKWCIDQLRLTANCCTKVSGIKVTHSMRLNLAGKFFEEGDTTSIDIAMDPLTQFCVNRRELLLKLPDVRIIKEDAIVDTLTPPTPSQTFLESIQQLGQRQQRWSEEAKRTERLIHESALERQLTRVVAAIEEAPVPFDPYSSYEQINQWRLFNSRPVVIPVIPISVSDPTIEIVDETDAPLPQDILDESHALAQLHQEATGERLNMTETFELEDTFKKVNPAFFMLHGNVAGATDEITNISAKQCVVCREKRAIVILNCGQRVLCKGCAETYRYLNDVCPVCRTTITTAIIPYV